MTMIRRDALDPITVEVVRNKLEGIANEMESTLLRSSFSPIVKEGLDASASLFTIQGETLAQAIAIPIHLATMIPILGKILETWPIGTMQDGDIYVMNDPYLGGTHLPDLAFVMPIFSEGKPIAFSATMTHHQDVGGMTPGSIPTNATEIFQEGLRVPPLKFHDRGVPNETLIAMLRLNSRIPDTFMGDINAQVAACKAGARRLQALSGRYGAENLTSIFDNLLDRSETMTREALLSIPDGVYEYEDWLDNDGIELDKPIRIAVRVTVEADSFHVDFKGTSSQVRGPFNCVPSGSRAAIYYAVRAVTDVNIPTNGGCFRPVSFETPEGSIVNPMEPAAVNSRTATIKRVTGCILGALREALPERIPADHAGEMLALMFGGKHKNGTPYVVGELIAGGSGAGPELDGVDVIETDATNCMNMPIEAFELDAPVRLHRASLRADSGGPGRRRGGLGTIREYEILHGPVVFTHRGERHFFQAQGARGGRQGASAISTIIRADGREETIASKLVTELQTGDRVIIQTAGGGGFGPPDERAPECVQADLDNGKVTPETARKHYRSPDRLKTASV